MIWKFDACGFDFQSVQLSGIQPELYSVYQAAKAISTGSRNITLANLASPELVTDEVFQLIVCALLLAKYDDLEGWSEFDDLMYFISEETEVSVCAEAYLYGEGESMRATPEEIDDLMQRIKDDSGFLNRCCSNLDSVTAV